MRILPLLALVLVCAASCKPRAEARAPSQTPEESTAEPSALALADTGPVARFEVQQGTFGFASNSGAEILALESLPAPRAIAWAVCGDGRAVPVTYGRTQIAQDSAWDMTAEQFPRLGGQVFQLTARRVAANGACYLSSDSGLASSVRPVETAHAICDASAVNEATATKGRPSRGCTVIAEGERARIMAIEFVPRDTSALASIVLQGPRGLRYWDIEATYRGEGEDVWRVDDGGHFSASLFTVLFLGTYRGASYMGLSWAASEGENEYLLAADSGTALREVAHVYRYWY